MLMYFENNWTVYAILRISTANVKWKYIWFLLVIQLQVLLKLLLFVVYIHNWQKNNQLKVNEMKM